MMGVKIELKGFHKKLSSENMLAGKRACANQAFVDMNENTVPLLDGGLRDSGSVAVDGSALYWSIVYANAQYRGTNGIAVFSDYSEAGTGPYWDEKAKGPFMSDWVKAFTKGAKI